MTLLIPQLLSSLEEGRIACFGELASEELAALKLEFSGAFDAERRAILAGLVFDVTGKVAEIEALNAGGSINQMGIVHLSDNTPVLPVSLLTWAWPGEGFAAAYDLLLTLPVRKITAADWAVSD